MSRHLRGGELGSFSANYASDILRDIEHRLRISLDSLLEGCQIISRDWRYVYLNETAARQGQRKREELLGRTMMEMYPGIDTTPLFGEMRAVMEERVSRRMRNHFAFPDGTRGWFDLSIEPVPEGIFILSIDISADVRREESLRESEERFRLITENAADLITLLDPRGRRTFTNPSVRSRFGETARLVGADAFDDVHPDDRDRLRSLFERAVAAGTGFRAEYRLRLPDGRLRQIESNFDVLRGASGTPEGVLAVERDVTERKMMEQQYLRAQRLDTVGALAGGIAHDLNNVLAPILVSLHALKGLVPSGQAQTMLETLEESASRGAGLVRQILSFTRGNDAGEGPVELGQVIAEVGRLVRVSFPRSITLRTVVPENLWPARGAATQIHQVLMNLVVNARDAMPDGGELTIEAANVTVGRNSRLAHPGVSPGSYVMLSVRDTGTGIPGEILGRIFEPFFTTKEEGRGTGLGLSTTQSIVRAHEGHLGVRSVVGGGTVFTVYLPRDRSATPPEAALPEIPAESNGRGDVVLLVDDEAALREITRTALEAHGFIVIPAADGAEAVEIFRDRGVSIDIVVTEVVMPFMDGHALIRELQKLDPGVKVLGVSGLIRDEYRGKYPDTERVRFLQKPYSAENLLRTMRGLLDVNAARPVGTRGR